jgi:hypothetical protein
MGALSLRPPYVRTRGRTHRRSHGPVGTRDDIAVHPRYMAELVASSRTGLDGAELALPWCNVFRLRDGLISNYSSYMDISPVDA